MRNYIHIILFVCFSAFSQSHVISRYEKYDDKKKYVKYFNLLNERDNSLILKIDHNKFIIYKENNEINAVSIGYLSGKVLEKKIISKTELKKYNLILDSLHAINPNLLNETSKKDSDSIMEIQDGTVDQLELFKSNYFIEYKSYAAADYINFKVSFYEERIRFLNVIKSANKLFYENEHEILKHKDTIYLSINEKDLSKLKISKTKGPSGDIYALETLKNNFVHVSFNQKSIQENRKSFFKKNVIINLDYLDKYGLDWIIYDPKKVIFIIEEGQSNKKGITLKKVVFKRII